MGKITARSTGAYRRKQIRNRLKHTAEICPICGGVLDWTIKNIHDPQHVELDEIIPVSLFQESDRLRAVTDVNNIQAVHRICNQKKGNRIGFTLKRVQNTGQSIHTSQEW